jgi:hypothetical protein
MRRLAAGALLLAASVAPLPAAHAADTDSDPVTEATARAVEFWGGAPCGGMITVLGGPAEEAPAAGENDGEAGPGVRAAMWATWSTPSGANEFVSPTLLSDCVVHVNLAVWPSWRADDREFAAFCKDMLHEYGHFEGYPDVGAVRYTIEYEQPALARVPLCERYRLIYGHDLYTATRPRGRPLRSARGGRRRAHR